MRQFTLNFCPRTVIKGQALTDFIVEFTYTNTAKVAGSTDSAEVAKVVEADDRPFM